MVRRSSRPARLAAVLLVAVLTLGLALPAAARSGTTLSGLVVDEGGASVPGARITIVDANGGLVRSTRTSREGTFSVDSLHAGEYAVVVELSRFATVMERVLLSATPVRLRLVLRAGGFAEDVVVTARRVQTRVADVPQKIEVIDAADIERTVAGDVTDLLKKNAGVDAIQYSGVLSGIGIRGFRPQFSGINKRSLLLLDGRPSGITNLATLPLGSIDHVEVLKGAASSLYGPSAMGGVVNVVTRESRGPVGGSARIGAGSFGAAEVAVRAGGNAASHLDFDLAGGLFDQRGDLRMGNGEQRPATSYATHDGSARLGLDLAGWRLQGRVVGYRGRDIETPGDLATGLNAQGRKNLARSSEDIRIANRFAAHDAALVVYHAAESGRTENVTTTDPLDQPYLPYLSFENELSWAGLQLRDDWRWSGAGSLVIGLDYASVSSVSRSFARSGEPIAPFSADSSQRTAGVYAENTLRWHDARTVVTFGARLDHLTTETLATPLKTNFRPSASAFVVFNPSFGIKHQFREHLRGHFAIGRAFLPAEASMLTGDTTTTVGGRTQISRGNADLRPERSTSFDAGVEWTSSTTRVDLTFFHAVVTDRFISNVVVSSPAPPAPIVLSVINGLDAHLSGLEFEADRRIGPRVGLFANTIHYFNREERLTNGLQQDILNVPLHTIRAGTDLDFGRLGARVTARHVRGRKDNDFSRAGFPIVDYDNFTTVDLSATYRLAPAHSLGIHVNNLFDEFYYEKIGYPLAGASFKVFYRVGF